MKTAESLGSRVIFRTQITFWDTGKYLNGGFLLDGIVNLNGDNELVNTMEKYGILFENHESVESSITIQNDLWYLNDTFNLAGEKYLDAYEIKEVI